MRFELAAPARVVFGPGTLREAAPAAVALGRHALVVVGRSQERATPLIEALAAQAVTTSVFRVTGEPTLAAVRAGVGRARSEGADVVIGMGGGSVLDAAKAVAGLATNGAEPLDYVEVIGRGRPLTRPALPWIAIPTTAGTGAEVTRNAVLTSEEHKLKVSLRSPLLLASVAIVDPDLLASLPPAVVASSGLDAFTQLVEPFVSSRANALVDALCREGLARSARSLQRLHEGDTASDARVDLALASLFGGLALANAGLGAVHGLAGPIGGAFEAPHGAVCAALLPAVMEVNCRALSTRAPASAALGRYAEISAMVTGRAGASAADGIAWVRALSTALGIPGLSHWGVTDADAPQLAEKARGASSMRGNPIELTEEELIEIVNGAL